MSARGWVLAALITAGAATATTVAVRSSRREISGPGLPVRRDGGPGIRARAFRAAGRVSDLAGQAGEFMRIVSTESAARQSELRRRLGLDE